MAGCGRGRPRGSRNMRTTIYHSDRLTVIITTSIQKLLRMNCLPSCRGRAERRCRSRTARARPGPTRGFVAPTAAAPARPRPASGGRSVAEPGSSRCPRAVSGSSQRVVVHRVPRREISSAGTRYCGSKNASGSWRAGSASSSSNSGWCRIVPVVVARRGHRRARQIGLRLRETRRCGRTRNRPG